MRKSILFPLLTLLVVCSKIASAQMWVTQEDQLVPKREFTDQEMKTLKATKTVFFLQPGTKAHTDSIKRAVSDVWNITPLIFDDFTNADKYLSDPTYSYFVFGGVISSGSYGTSTHYFLTLQLPVDVTRKGKIKTIGLCRIELFPNRKTLDQISNIDVGKLYNEGSFYNFSPIFIKAQLQAVSTDLKNNVRPKLFEQLKPDSLSQVLTTDTLYVPQSILMSFNPFGEKEEVKKENPFDKYPYKYRICTDAELYTIFQTQKRGRLLFEYVKSSSDKFIKIYDMKNKTVIYKRYAAVSYNLKEGDIHVIVR